MVAAVPDTAVASRNPPHHNKSAAHAPIRDDIQSPHRSPLIPSEKDNAAAGAVRRPRAKEITSRYLSLYSSSSSSTSTSYSTATSLSSISSSNSRRFPSPLVTDRPSTPPASPDSAAQKRSRSVGRARPETNLADPRPTTPEPSVAKRSICMTTRSLSVSFQGESFFYQTSRAKAASPSPTRKATPERRRASPPAVASPTKVSDHLENSRPFDNHHRWPSSRAQPPNSIVGSFNCSSEKKEPILATFRLLQQSIMFDDRTRTTSLDEGDLSASSDTDSVSSGSNSGAAEFSVPFRAKATPRGTSMPARLSPETNSRLGRYPDPSSLLSSPDSRSVVQQKLGSVRKFTVDSPLSSPRSTSSPLRRASSPSKLAASPTRGIASPLRTRNNSSLSASPIGQPGNAPSIISFAAEVRRAKKGENRIEEAHMLRLLDNRHLQWRSVNARADTALLVQKLTVEKNLYDAWITTSELRDSITIERISLQLLIQNLKLTTILKGQMAYLEELCITERDYLSSLSGAIEALKASTLRLPLVNGAKADVLDVKDALGSAVATLQTMGSSIFSLLSKVEATTDLVSEITEVVAQERALLGRSRDLLSTVAAFNVNVIPGKTVLSAGASSTTKKKS